jgi:hypothetical protein
MSTLQRGSTEGGGPGKGLGEIEALLRIIFTAITEAVFSRICRLMFWMRLTFVCCHISGQPHTLPPSLLLHIVCCSWTKICPLKTTLK